MTESWQLRTHMIFIVDNLQHYLMADVLESQYSMLIKKFDQSTNFEEIRHSHDVFLSTITSHTFINNKSANHCLSELLKVCQQFGLKFHTREIHCCFACLQSAYNMDDYREAKLFSLTTL